MLTYRTWDFSNKFFEIVNNKYMAKSSNNVHDIIILLISSNFVNIVHRRNSGFSIRGGTSINVWT